MVEIEIDGKTLHDYVSAKRGLDAGLRGDMGVDLDPVHAHERAGDRSLDLLADLLEMLAKAHWSAGSPALSPPSGKRQAGS